MNLIRVGLVVVIFVLAGSPGCTRAVQSPGAGHESAQLEAQAERERQEKAGPAAIASPETREQVSAVAQGKITVEGDARIGVLYFQDRPAHQKAVLDWLKNNGGEILFHSERFGYVDATLPWAMVASLINTSGKLGLEESSMMKLELEEVEAEGGTSPRERAPKPAPGGANGMTDNTSFTGPAHSAGYGTKLEEFRAVLAKEFGKTTADFEGQGTVIAVFDGGIDMSRTDVIGPRMRDYVIGDEANWKTGRMGLEEFMKSEDLETLPAGLEDVKSEASLKVVALSERAAKYDFNQSGWIGDNIAVAIYLKDGKPEARFRPAKGLPFGDVVVDLGRAHSEKKPQLINLATGRYYDRKGNLPPPSAVGVKFRIQPDKTLEVAFVGTAVGAEHGIANLHMVGGDYVDGASQVRYRGVAPKTEFIGAQTWRLDRRDYAEKWIPLARTIIAATEANADVLDLDIYTPGSAAANDILSKLVCRITATTHTVPVVASHNYGPLPNTVQSLAQSPCVLGIGASNTAAALRVSRNQGNLDPALSSDDSLQIANYSGRGFGLNGLYKPDIISPAYAYTAYGPAFTRFGGTSGATPTTAGLVVLLKQAARMKGVELGLDQVRLLLQSSSLAPAHPRDGYGFVNILEAWNAFKKLSSGLAPIVLDGHLPLQFDGRPVQQIIPLMLKRRAVLDSVSTPVGMKFWIEYGGASADTRHEWLKFYETSEGKTSSAIEKDAPMHGETQTLKLAIDLPDAVWASLPVGDHIAIVKGVRKSLAGGRAADFLLPVAFTKGEEIDEKVFDLGTIFADQYKIFSIATKPGDQLWISGESKCLGRQVEGAIRGGATDSLRLSIDHEAFYPQAEMMMNNYAALSLSSSPIRVTAKKQVVRINVSRYLALNCEGPFGGTLRVRKAGFTVSAPSVSILQKENAQSIKVNAQIGLTGGGLSDNELYRAVKWVIATAPNELLLRTTANGPTQFKVPAGVKLVRVLPKNPMRFQGLLVSQSPEGEIVDDSSTFSTNTSAPGGFGSISVDFGGKFTGLALEEPAAGNTVHYAPAAVSSGEATSPAVIEIRMKAPAAITTELSLPEEILTGVSRWNASQLFPLNWSIEVPGSRPEALKDFAPTDWSYELGLGLSIEEQMPNGTGTAKYLPVKLLETTVPVPLILK